MERDPVDIDAWLDANAPGLFREMRDDIVKPILQRFAAALAMPRGEARADSLAPRRLGSALEVARKALLEIRERGSLDRDGEWDGEDSHIADVALANIEREIFTRTAQRSEASKNSELNPDREGSR